MTEDTDAMTTQEPRTYDVVLVSDFRFSGGNSATNATEIRAQAAAGYRTALVHLPSPVLRTPRPLSHKIREFLEEGLAPLELAEKTQRTRPFSDGGRLTSIVEYRHC
jgi:hypothetical protein